MRRSLATCALALALVALLAGCDQTEEVRTDAELLVGTWKAEAVRAETQLGVSVPVYSVGTGDEAAVSFDEGSGGGAPAFSLVFDPAEGRSLELPGTSIRIPLSGSVELEGLYTLDEEEGQITLDPSNAGAPTITLDYEVSEDDLTIVADDPQTLAVLVGLAANVEAVQVLASVVTGGSIEFRRD